MKLIFTVIRSTLFFICQVVFAILISSLAFCVRPLGWHYTYAVTSKWAQSMVWLARVLCGVRYEVTGLENIPQNAQPHIILSKHQSAWETMAFQVFFPPQVWVLKRELFKIPFFGWGLYLLKSIGIDRGNIREALRQVVEQGKERLAIGSWIVVFPEGTRVKPGERGKYQVGGAFLAVQTQTPVIPVAHNAGHLWAKGSFLRYPGTIKVIIGKPIDPKGMKANDLNQQVENWIETQMTQI